jgi:hypothetical protein
MIGLVLGGHGLIRELLADPHRFHEDGRGYDLLRVYLGGFPLETLRPLLGSDDPLVQRAAMFVASGLGSAADDLIEDVIPFLESPDDLLRVLAMRLVSMADAARLEEARRRVGPPRDAHGEGLRILAARARVEPGILSAMIRDRDPLRRRYGAIAARRLIQRFPILLDDVAASDDADVRGLFQEPIE